MMIRQLLLPATTALSLLSHLNGAAALVLERSSISPDLEELPRPAGLNDLVLPMRFGLTQPNLTNADAYIFDVSDPSSPNFAQYWTAEQVSDTFKPSVASYSAVRAWILAAGIPAENVATAPDGRGWLRSNMTVSQAESLLQTTYNVYESKSSGGTFLTCEQYSIPDNLADDIDVVTPGIKLMRVNLNSVSSSSSAVARRSQAGDIERRYNRNYPPFHPWPPAADNLSTCYTAITPNCVRALYNIPELKSSHPDNSMGIFSTYPSPESQRDLDLFFKYYAPQLVGKGPTVIGIDHGNKTAPISEIDTETSLDVQLTMPLVYPLIPKLYAVGNGLFEEGSDELNIVEDLDNLLDAFDASYCKYDGGGQYNGTTQCGGLKVPNVVSASYGQPECGNSPHYMVRECHEFMKQALQGITWVFPTGDQGVTDNYPTYCPNQGVSFYPNFPASCPWVTAVGSTQMKTKATVHEAQEATQPDTATTSGGGFSNIFGRPAYQNKTVESWFKNHPTGYGPEYFNHTSRAYPDLSASGAYIMIAYNGSLEWSGGTSAATPIYASAFTIVNDYRLRAGKKPIGFVNPVLYAHPEVFTDITEGNNMDGTSKNGTPAGFSAVSGWDPVTGMGTLHLDKLIDVYMTLP